MSQRREPAAPSVVRPSGQWFVAMKGAPGSGKTTLARALSRRLAWPLIDKDDVRDLLDDSNPGLAYDVMFNIGQRQLLQGLSVICDSPLGYRRSYEHAMRISEETGASLAIVECCCSDESLWRQRIEARQTLGLPSHHTITWDAVRAFHERTAQESRYPITHPHVVLDTTRPVADLCEQVVSWLASR